MTSASVYVPPAPASMSPSSTHLCTVERGKSQMLSIRDSAIHVRPSDASIKKTILELAGQLLEHFRRLHATFEPVITRLRGLSAPECDVLATQGVESPTARDVFR